MAASVPIAVERFKLIIVVSKNSCESIRIPRMVIKDVMKFTAKRKELEGN